MFSRKKNFSNRFLFSKASIIEIVSQLRNAYFDEITFKIPNEYSKFNKLEFNDQEFINLNYNFVSQILIAKNKYETIKILFVNNSSSKTVFNDSIFPSSNSEDTKFYVETNDPVRIIGLIDFLDTLLKENSLRGAFVSRFQNRLLLISSIFLLIMITSFGNLFGEVSDSVATFFYQHILLLSFLTLLSFLYIFYYSITPGGLYINKFEHPFISFSKRIFIGDLKDNLLVSFFLFIFKLLLGGFLVNILWFFLGETTINALRFLQSLIV